MGIVKSALSLDIKLLSGSWLAPIIKHTFLVPFIVCERVLIIDNDQNMKHASWWLSPLQECRLGQSRPTSHHDPISKICTLWDKGLEDARPRPLPFWSGGRHPHSRLETNARAPIQYTFGWSTEPSIEIPFERKALYQLFSLHPWWESQMVLLNWKAFERDF